VNIYIPSLYLCPQSILDKINATFDVVGYNFVKHSWPHHTSIQSSATLHQVLKQIFSSIFRSFYGSVI